MTDAPVFPSSSERSALRQSVIEAICPHIKRWCDDGDGRPEPCKACPHEVVTSEGIGVQMCRLNAQAAADDVLRILDLAQEQEPAVAAAVDDPRDEPAGYNKGDERGRCTYAQAPIDPTNHHNALLCPYCNPQGLKFAQGSQDWRLVDTAPHETYVLLGWWDEGKWNCQTGMASPGWRRGPYSTMSQHGQATHWMPLPAGPSAPPTNRVGLLDPGIDGPYNEPCEHKSVHDGPRVDMRWGSAPTQVCDCGMWRVNLHVPGIWREPPVSPVTSTEEKSP